MATVSDVATTIASYHHGDFPVAELRAMKKDQRISVCIPARDEGATVGAIVEIVRRELVDGVGLVDDLLVVDDRSMTRPLWLPLPQEPESCRCRRSMGRRSPQSQGRGDAPWARRDRWRHRRLPRRRRGEFRMHFVTGLLGPVLACPETMLVKACYRRPLGESSTGGGRVTELVARPLVSLLFPSSRA